MPDFTSPPGSAADRNLLLGILAVRMDFVDRDSLVTALHAWTPDKAKPLGHILRDQGGLSAQRLALLETLVEEYRRAHHGDPQRSLAALAGAAALPAELNGIITADFQASPLGATTGYRTPSPPTPFTSDPSATVETSRYRVLQEHARGGLGLVSIAHDEELDRQVALKEIQPAFADDPDSRSRFLLEARVSGRLEHPGIVPVYGLGQSPDGRPYYAMRLIKGESLKDAIKRFHDADAPGRDAGERRLALRQLLGRFVAVCYAVAYAHSRGIIHRDIKPANVMLGEFGETLLVDWGLAKVVGRPAQAKADHAALAAGVDHCGTQVGRALGTPAFMSPEQARGDGDTVGPSSDVYGLGATLSALLTGQPPVQGQRSAELVQKAIRGEVRRPGQVKKDVPAALEAVCLKALALLPADRYGSALELAADTERWLADEPVSAYREPWAARAGRWMRRHQPLVAAAAATLLAVVLLGGLGVWWVGQQAARERQAVETALGEVVQLQGQARWAEARAVLEQAEGRLGNAGAAELRGRLKQARHQLDLVARLEAIRLKRSTFLMEGHLDHATADRDYEEAFRAAGMTEVGGNAAEAATWVGGTGVRAALVAALDDWAGCTKERSRRSWVLEVSRRADQDSGRDRLRDPAVWDDPAALTKLAGETPVAELSPQLLAVLGRRLMELKGDSEQLLRAAQERHPDDFWVNFTLGLALEKDKPGEAVGYYRAALAVRPSTLSVVNNLAGALLRKGQLDEAIAELHKAIELDPQHPAAHTNLAGALLRKGQLDEAVAEGRKAIELAPQFPAAHFNLGNALHYQNKLGEAIAEYRKAIELDVTFAAPHCNLGIVLQYQHKLDQAIAEYRKAIELDPKSQAHIHLGHALSAGGQPDESIAEYRKAIEIDPKLAMPHYSLGLAFHDQHKLDEAIAEYRRAIELDPKHALAHNNLGNALSTKGRLDEAIDLYRKAIEIDPKHVLAHNNVGLALAAAGHLDEAIAMYRKAIALDPKYAPAHSNLASALSAQGRKDELAHYNRGLALKAKGDLDGAVGEFRRAWTLNPDGSGARAELLRAFSRQGRSDEIETIRAVWQKSLEHNPPNHDAWFGYAELCLYLGCDAEYRRHRRDLLARFGDSADPVVAERVSRACLLLPASGEELKRAADLAARAVAAGPAHDYYGYFLATRGLAEYRLGHIDRALDCLRQADGRGVQMPVTRLVLAMALHHAGQIRPASQTLVAALQSLEGIETTEDVPYQGIALVLRREAEAVVVPNLCAFLKGTYQPRDSKERLELIEECQLRKRYGTAARLYAVVLVAEPKLADDLKSSHRYNAACCAALAAAGQGEDAAKLSGEERARLRKQALGCLRADLALWAQQVETGKSKTRAEAQKVLQQWQADSDLAGLREMAGLTQLTAEERAECHKLWANVEALLKKQVRQAGVLGCDHSLGVPLHPLPEAAL